MHCKCIVLSDYRGSSPLPPIPCRHAPAPTTSSSADSGSDRADSNSTACTTATHVSAYATSESRCIAPKRGTAAPTGQYLVPTPNPSLTSLLYNPDTHAHSCPCRHTSTAFLIAAM